MKPDKNWVESVSQLSSRKLTILLDPSQKDVGCKKFNPLSCRLNPGSWLKLEFGRNRFKVNRGLNQGVKERLNVR